MIAFVFNRWVNRRVVQSWCYRIPRLTVRYPTACQTLLDPTRVTADMPLVAGCAQTGPMAWLLFGLWHASFAGRSRGCNGWRRQPSNSDGGRSRRPSTWPETSHSPMHTGCCCLGPRPCHGSCRRHCDALDELILTLSGCGSSTFAFYREKAWSKVGWFLDQVITCISRV